MISAPPTDRVKPRRESVLYRITHYFVKYDKKTGLTAVRRQEGKVGRKSAKSGGSILQRTVRGVEHIRREKLRRDRQRRRDRIIFDPKRINV